MAVFLVRRAVGIAAGELLSLAAERGARHTVLVSAVTVGPWGTAATGASPSASRPSRTPSEPPAWTVLRCAYFAAFVGIGEEEAGLGAGLTNTSQEAGSALGLTVVATVAYDGITEGLAAAGGNPALIRDAQAAANYGAFLSAACLGLIALLLVMFLMPRARAPVDSRQASESSEPTPAVRFDLER